MNIGHLEEIGAALCDAILQFSIFEKLLGDKKDPYLSSRIGNKPESYYSMLQHQHQLQHQDELDLEVQAELDLDINVEVELELEVEVDVGVGGTIKDQSNNRQELNPRNGARKLNCDHDNFNDQYSENALSGKHQREGLMDKMVAEKGRNDCSTLSTSFSTSTSTAFSALHINGVDASTDRVSCNHQSTNTGTYTFLVQLLNLFTFSLLSRALSPSTCSNLFVYASILSSLSCTHARLSVCT
jgi:hypothetical protein